MKKSLLLIHTVSIILVFSLAGCYVELEKESVEEHIEQPIVEEVTEELKEENSEESGVEEEKADTNDTTTTTEQNNSAEETYSKELYDNIEFSVEIQDVIDGKQKIVVYIKNNNKNYTFSGTIKFYALSTNNDILCLDYIYPYDIPPGIESWAILWGKPGLYDSYSVTISEANFREVAKAPNIDYEEIGITGVFVFIYTSSTDCSELQKIVDIYKNDRFKSRKVFELDFFNDRKKAMDAFTNADGVGFGMMLPVATYNYNANIGLDELNCYFEE